ncbi:hypothetical protein TUM19329_29020 [Legionella antarctica]|uniref:Uncharacterized protein n=1 Tax=Legionella antarctica TaxID=2708020 RepID=A0A6F8T7W0_9GAMM|nr:hypothetical protein [Legionella antarctica]BCA96541.1 hypothetical protein TUM19329_29020 [Legionella antarctica]
MPKLSKQQIENIFDKVDAEFFILPSKIGDLGITSDKGLAATKQLKEDLINARNNYKDALNADDGKSYQEVGNEFISACTLAANRVEKNLGLGEYLENMLKTITNAVIKIGTVGQVSNFFSKKSATEIGKSFENQVTKAHEEIKQDEEADKYQP